VWVLAKRGWVTRADGWNPTFSPSGSLIAYETPSGVVATRLDGSKSRRLAPRGTDPVWSPTGREIAYRGLLSGRVALVQANGEKRRHLSAIHGPFAWAPNGRELAWIDGAAIHAIGSNGHGLRQIAAVDQSGVWPSQLEWLTSGWLAYRRDGPPAFQQEAQLFVNRSGGAERLLVTRMTLDAHTYADT
jgi:Tol biopolymer transport system component